VNFRGAYCVCLVMEIRNAGPLKVNDTWYEFSQNVEERAINFNLTF